MVRQTNERRTVRLTADNVWHIVAAVGVHSMEPSVVWVSQYYQTHRCRFAKQTNAQIIIIKVILNRSINLFHTICSAVFHSRTVLGFHSYAIGYLNALQLHVYMRAIRSWNMRETDHSRNDVRWLATDLHLNSRQPKAYEWLSSNVPN